MVSKDEGKLIKAGVRTAMVYGGEAWAREERGMYGYVWR